MPGGGRGCCLGLLLDLPLEEAAALGLVDDLHVVVDGHVRPVRRVAVVLGTSCGEKSWNRYLLRFCDISLIAALYLSVVKISQHIFDMMHLVSGKDTQLQPPCVVM